MKKILGIVVLGFLLSGCAAPQYVNTYNDVLNLGYTYTAIAESKKLMGQDKWAWGGSNISQADANSRAMNTCNAAYSDCVAVKEGSRTVYNKEEAEKIQLTLIIEETKNTCKTLGFKQGTDKFSDCALKLYTKKIELAEKQNQQVVVQSPESSVVRVIDLTRERENNMRRSMSLINGTCTVANYYSC